MSKRNATRRYLNCAVAAALGLGAGLVHAAEPASPGAGFVQSASGAVVMTGTGDCLRSGTWEPGSTAPGCAGYQPEPVADASAEPQPAPQPEVAAIEPAPAPVETAAFERSLDARALFPFDSAELTDEGKSQLDELVASVDGERPVSKVAIDAYADHIGESAYNEQLSQRRAESVAAYLRGRLAAQGAAFEARGHGEAPAPAQCEPPRQGESLIACLAPNRRAEVSVELEPPRNAAAGESGAPLRTAMAGDTEAPTQGAAEEPSAESPAEGEAPQPKAEDGR